MKRFKILANLDRSHNIQQKNRLEKDGIYNGTTKNSQVFFQNGISHSELICVLLLILFLMGLSFALGCFVGFQKINSCDNVSSGFEPFPSGWFGYYTPEERRKESDRLLSAASTFSGEKGEGRLGWLHLLASYTYNRTNLFAVSNLISNYFAVNYPFLAYSVFLESNITQKELTLYNLFDSRTQNIWSDYFQEQKHLLNDPFNAGQLTPKNGCFSLLFNTVIGKWSLDKLINRRPQLNENIYNKTVEEYLRLKQSLPELSSTDLNHQFFSYQMDNLDASNSFWNPMTKVSGFSDLVQTMRFAVVQFLRDYHGWTTDDAVRKASHSMVVWLSVHTEESIHQPHVTEDALVGGVYYISAPSGSGVLDLFDPRGKHPINGLRDPTSPPEPPFHRSHSITPKESTLILFPGWLVHSVRSASRMSKPKALNREQMYRVSMSLNLKGEWIDTSNSAFGCRTAHYAE
jgi:uncharacterized protein (TIGR02466 family)